MLQACLVPPVDGVSEISLPMITIRIVVKIIVAILQFWHAGLIQNGSIVKLAPEF